MSLSCGGRGPCCHIGYAHRHCEHCDTVIAVTVQPHTHYPWYSPTYYGTFSGYQGQLNSMLQQSPLQALQAQFNQIDEPQK